MKNILMSLSLSDHTYICIGHWLSIFALDESFLINKVIIQGTDASPEQTIVLLPTQFRAPAATTPLSSLKWGQKMYLNYTFY